MTDLFEKCREFFTDPAYAEALGYPASPQRAKDLGIYAFFIPLDRSEGTEVTIGGRKLIMLGSNNYLGLTMHPDVRRAASEAVGTFGTSCTGSRFLNGTLALHGELERRLATYVGKEKALVFTTGYQANLGTLSSLVGRGDIVVCDKEDHASIVDGCRLALGRMVRFRHNDSADLDRVLAKCPDGAAQLVVVDGVFSMGGDIALLPDLVRVCRAHGARLMVDDAHGIGVVGRGQGTSAHYGVTDEVDLIVGTFSKSLASIGGFVAGDESTICWIQHAARSLMFSASLPAPNVAAALAALDVMEREPERVDRVNRIAGRMRNAYRDLGFDIGESQTPIVPIFVGDSLKAMHVWRSLFDAGIYVNVAIPPAVPPGKALLRTSYMATHTDEQMERVLDAFATVGKRHGLIS